MCPSRALGLSLVLIAAGYSPALAQQRQGVADRPDQAVLQALQTNPYTAPYRIGANWRDGKLVLSGRVGTKQIHDVALRIALVYTSTIRDDIVIDTAEAHRVAAQGAATPLMRGSAATAMPSLGSMPYTLGSLPYVYPQPLFGRLDDPFFGFEPPLLSYPPWWGGVAARDLAGAPAPTPLAANPTAPAPETLAPAGAAGTSPADGTVEMTLNSRGVATLRGTVNNLAERIAIGQEVAQTPGITEVINLIDVKAPGTATSRSSAVPPPPPQPALVPGVKPADAPKPRPAIAVDAGNLTPRLTDALARRPALAGLAIRVSLQDGVAELSGRVPTVYEAMLAFRSVQQTPGVHQVVDRLQFEVPDGEMKNPLLAKGRPEDVEPYLAAQLARQLGDLAHVDQVRLRGDTLQIRGTIAQPEDRARLDAILRSMAILRGFQVTSEFSSD